MFRISPQTVSAGPLKIFPQQSIDIQYRRRQYGSKERREGDPSASAQSYADKLKKAKKRDKLRINITNEGICKDVIDRLKPSLERHKNCDIIDINPGVGLWSAAFHEAIEPRTHILMEPESDVYLPFLQPLLDQKKSKYKLFPGSGIIWENLRKLETENYLPHQKRLPQGDPGLEKRNDSLLFIANLGFYPNRAYMGFPSVATLMLHQLMTAIRAHSIFQGYGLVRMLVWMRDSEKSSICPRMISSRKKSCVEAEVSCENIFEIAGSDELRLDLRREHAVDLESALAVAQKMLQVNTKTPVARRGTLEKAATKGLNQLTSFGSDAIRPFHKELEELEALYAAGAFETHEPIDPTNSADPKRHAPQAKPKRTAEFKRLMYLRARAKEANKYTNVVDNMLMDYEHIFDKYAELQNLGTAEVEKEKNDLQEKMARWKFRLNDLQRIPYITLTQRLDDRRAFHQDPPILLWDRREAEPLMVKKDDFFPQNEMCLLDFHPKSVWPIMQGENFTNYDYFELIISYLFMNPKQPISKGLWSLAPGADEWIIPRCPSLIDMAKGGVMNVDQLSVRTLNQAMLREIIEAWMDWPFRPSKAEMIGKLGPKEFEGLDDNGVFGSGNNNHWPT